MQRRISGKAPRDTMRITFSITVPICLISHAHRTGHSEEGAGHTCHTINLINTPIYSSKHSTSITLPSLHVDTVLCQNMA